MSTNYTKHVNPRGKTLTTPQTEAIPGRESEMTANNAGGVTFTVSQWDYLDRFLILGSEGGTFYVGERKLTQDAATNVQKCIDTDGLRVVKRIVEVSKGGLAPKNDPALFALAMCSAAGDEAVRKAALAALPQVARIGTHLMHYAEFVQAFRGWGRALRRAVGDWFNAKDTDDLVYQIMKYKARDGWSNRDLLRLSHPQTDDAVRNTLYKWIVKKDSVNLKEFKDGPLARLADKFVTTRIKHKCDICAGAIEKKEKVRAISEQYGEKKIRSFYFCNECCYAMAEFWSDGGKKWDARVALKAEKKK